MLINITCPECGAEVEARSTISPRGSEISCPKCGALVAIPSQPITPGLQLGGFQIIKLLGKGGMGQVFLARQLSMEREVALKVLLDSGISGDAAEKRFLEEVRVSASLNHRHIVTAFEAGNQDDVHFLAMEYVPGGTLSARIKHVGKLSESEALSITRKIATALQYAWETHEMLHRDVKPSNIMFDEQGEPELLDMGLSKCLSNQGDVSTVTMVVGSPQYMAPEQARAANLDTRADMYGLGATLYHMITGHVPFPGAPGEASMDMQDLLRRIEVEDPDPCIWNNEISEGCEAFIHRLLSKRPENRYPNWQALIDDIDRIAAGGLPYSSEVDQELDTQEFDMPPKGKLPVGLREGGLLRAAMLLLLGGGLAWGGYALWENRNQPVVPPALSGADCKQPPWPANTPLETLRAHIEKAWPGQGGNLVMAGSGLHFELNGSSGVTDLCPLQGMDLHSMDIRGSAVGSLRPLAGMTKLLECKGIFLPYMADLHRQLDADPEHLARALEWVRALERIPVLQKQNALVEVSLEKMQLLRNDPKKALAEAPMYQGRPHFLWLEPQGWNQARELARSLDLALVKVSDLAHAEWIKSQFRLEGAFVWINAACDSSGAWVQEGEVIPFHRFDHPPQVPGQAATFGAQGKWSAYEQGAEHPCLLYKPGR